MHISSDGLIPTATATYDMGTSAYKWRNMYATAFNGLATQAIALQVGANYRTGDVNSTNNTVAVRDASGNLAANVFNGVSTSARYADLAEKYTTAEELPAGTAVAVRFDDVAEVGPASASSMAIGVVSTDPAYMMNSEAEGQYIGLKGRLPVRVKGPVNKGQAIYAWEDGVCSTIATTALIGMALESNTDDSEKLVECVLKV